MKKVEIKELLASGVILENMVENTIGKVGALSWC